jgi:hypothetical protein
MEPSTLGKSQICRRQATRNAEIAPLWAEYQKIYQMPATKRCRQSEIPK